LEQIKFAYGDLKRVHIMEYTKAALPYWIVSLAGMSLLYFVLKDEKHFYSLFFRIYSCCHISSCYRNAEDVFKKKIIKLAKTKKA
jgi:hypothetical protein